MLLRAGREFEPEWQGRHRRGKEDHQDNAGHRIRQAERIFRHEQIVRRGNRDRRPDQQFHQEYRTKIPVFQRRHDGLEIEFHGIAAVAPHLPVRHEGAGEKRNDWQRDQQGPAHHSDLSEPIDLDPGHAQDRRHREQRQHGDNAGHFRPGEEAGPIIIVYGNCRHPGRPRRLQQGETDIEKQHPDDEIARPGAPFRHIDEIGGKPQQRDAEHDPVPYPAPRAAIAVDHIPHDRVGQNIPEPQDHEQEAGQLQSKANFIGVERCKIHRQRQSDPRQRYAERGKGEYSR